MDINSVAAKRTSILSLQGDAVAQGSAASANVSYLSMYAEAPNHEVTLEDFEISAFERLKVLRMVEQARSRGTRGKELNDLARSLAKEHIGGGNDISTVDIWRKDQVSHHILRLAFCNSEEKRRWFLAQEATLFQARLEAQSPKQTTDFLRRHGLAFVAISDDERMRYAIQLRQTWEAVKHKYVVDGDANGNEFERVTFFKVPFTQAKELVRARQVFLAAGFAFVPQVCLIAIIVNRFRAYLGNAVKAANRFLPIMLADERLEPILRNMSTAYTGPEYGAGKGKLGDRISPDDIDKLATSAFPLCMQNLNDALHKDHHLQHDGRMQYGLFLKGLGVTMEDSLVFWQREFTRSMTPEEFLKKYSYNIRHNYGKEGKRADYTPYACTRIITGTAPANKQAHGCPYRHWDMTRLRSVLESMRLPTVTVTDILESVTRRDYQIGCRKQFEGRFPGAESHAVGNHPNGYADAAIAFLKEKAAKETAAASAAAVVVATAAGSNGGGGGGAAVSSSAATGIVGAGSGFSAASTVVGGVGAGEKKMETE